MDGHVWCPLISASLRDQGRLSASYLALPRTRRHPRRQSACARSCKNRLRAACPSDARFRCGVPRQLALAGDIWPGGIEDQSFSGDPVAVCSAVRRPEHHQSPATGTVHRSADREECRSERVRESRHGGKIVEDRIGHLTRSRIWRRTVAFPIGFSGCEAPIAAEACPSSGSIHWQGGLLGRVEAESQGPISAGPMKLFADQWNQADW